MLDGSFVKEYGSENLAREAAVEIFSVASALFKTAGMGMREVKPVLSGIVIEKDKYFQTSNSLQSLETMFQQIKAYRWSVFNALPEHDHFHLLTLTELPGSVQGFASVTVPCEHGLEYCSRSKEEFSDCSQVVDCCYFQNLGFTKAPKATPIIRTVRNMFLDYCVTAYFLGCRRQM